MSENVFEKVFLPSDVDVFSRAFDMFGANAVELSVVVQGFFGDIAEFFVEESNDLQNWGGRQSVATASHFTPFGSGKATAIASRYVRVVANANGGDAVASVTVRSAEL